MINMRHSDMTVVQLKLFGSEISKGELGELNTELYTRFLGGWLFNLAIECFLMELHERYPHTAVAKASLPQALTGSGND